MTIEFYAFAGRDEIVATETWVWTYSKTPLTFMIPKVRGGVNDNHQFVVFSIFTKEDPESDKCYWKIPEDNEKDGFDFVLCNPSKCQSTIGSRKPLPFKVDGHEYGLMLSLQPLEGNQSAQVTVSVYQRRLP